MKKSTLHKKNNIIRLNFSNTFSLEISPSNDFNHEYKEAITKLSEKLYRQTKRLIEEKKFHPELVEKGVFAAWLRIITYPLERDYSSLYTTWIKQEDRLQQEMMTYIKLVIAASRQENMNTAQNNVQPSILISTQRFPLRIPTKPVLLSSREVALRQLETSVNGMFNIMTTSFKTCIKTDAHYLALEHVFFYQWFLLHAINAHVSPELIKMFKFNLVPILIGLSEKLERVAKESPLSLNK